MKTSAPISGGSPHLRVNDLKNLSAALAVLAEQVPDRTSVAQLTFFLYAAAADTAGRPATFVELREALGPDIGKSLHTTYKVFLSSRDRDTRKQSALGWLTRELDPHDNRRKYLRLSAKGRTAIRNVLDALEQRR